MATNGRGRIQPPLLDDRDWSALVDEARALIPKYAPQWTDHNASDVGITLIELFAYLVEGLIFRLNQVPEKHYVEFLNLLGLTRDPAVPAKAFLTFRASPGGSALVPTGQRAQTRGSENERPIVFETDADVTIRPTNLVVAMHARKTTVGSRYVNMSSAFTNVGAAGATLSLPSGQSEILLGFDAPVSNVEIGFELTKPLAVTPASLVTTDWRYSVGTSIPQLWPAATVASDDTKGLREDGEVALQVPAAWAGQKTSAWGAALQPAAGTAVPPDTAYYWLTVRIQNLTGGAVELGVRRILFNAVAAHNALTVTNEQLGTSDGSPFQTFVLEHGPLFRRGETDTPYDHLDLQVKGTTWTLGDDLPPGYGKVFRLDPVAAEISFGDYDPVLRPDGHGSIPAAGDAVTAASYRYVAGGASGNVGAGTVVVMTTQVAGIVGVTNLGVGEGGADEETIEDAKRRAPEALRNRYRAVTLEDYAYLAREASTDVAIARALGPRVHQDTSTTYIEGDPWTYGLIDRGAGNVTVVVVPHTGVVAQRPEPTKDLLREVQRYLDRRREATARLRVTGPRYLPVKVTVDAWLWQRALDLGLVASAAAFYTDIENRLKAFLHPVTGGPEGKGWAVGQNVFVKDAYAAAMPDEELGYISSLIVAPETPAYTPVDRPFPATLTSPGAWVAVADYELVCGGQIVKVQHTPVAEI